MLISAHGGSKVGCLLALIIAGLAAGSRVTESIKTNKIKTVVLSNI